MPLASGSRRYLRAKGSVDARAINLQVRTAAAAALAEWPAERPVRALEVGGGAGGGLRFWMALLARFRRVAFTASDPDGDLLEGYRDEIREWGEAAGLQLRGEAGNRLRFDGGGRVLDFRLVEAAVPGGFDERKYAAFDLLLAQSFWDLTAPGTALSLGKRLVKPGGLFYGTLTFAGTTRFGPSHSQDRSVLACYHSSMAGERGGDPRAGERLLGEVRIPGSGFTELASGRSDWRVIPTPEGYPEDEAYFLSAILGFVEQELHAAAPIGPDEVESWMHTRRRQLRDRELSYSARQQDLLARRDRT